MGFVIAAGSRASCFAITTCAGSATLENLSTGGALMAGEFDKGNEEAMAKERKAVVEQARKWRMNSPYALENIDMMLADFALLREGGLRKRIMELESEQATRREIETENNCKYRATFEALQESQAEVDHLRLALGKIRDMAPASFSSRIDYANTIKQTANTALGGKERHLWDGWPLLFW
jgi:hypothetical protein